MSSDSCSFINDLHFSLRSFRIFSLNLIKIYPDIISTRHLFSFNLKFVIFFLVPGNHLHYLFKYLLLMVLVSVGQNRVLWVGSENGHEHSDSNPKCYLY